MPARARRAVPTSVMAAVAIAAMAGAASGGVPRLIAYQGKLSGVDPNATVNLTVKFYDAPTGGNVLFSEQQNSVSLNNGVFSINIGSQTTDGVPDSALEPNDPNAGVWLGMAVNGAPELTPRTRFVMVPYAAKAAGAEGLFRPGTFESIVKVHVGGNVGIGTTSPSELLELFDGSLAITRFDRYPVGDRFLRFSTRNQTAGEMHDWKISAEPIPGRYNVDQCISDLWIGHRWGSNPYYKLVYLSKNRVGINEEVPVGTLDVRGEYSDSVPALHVRKHSDLRRPNQIVLEVQGAVTDVNPKFFRIYTDNDDPWNLKARLDGRFISNVVEITGGADLAEPFGVGNSKDEQQKIEPGMVVVIDPDNPGQVKLASEPYDRKVAGIISGANGLKPGMVMSGLGTEAVSGQLSAISKDGANGESHHKGTKTQSLVPSCLGGEGVDPKPEASAEHPVALTGRVWCWCDAKYAPIQPGDLLTTSATAGHAMRADHTKDFPRGSVIGKAMTKLETGKGLVLVLVQPQ
jgi:hypothetical protein